MTGARVEATAGAMLLLAAPPTPLLLPARCPARVALDTVVCADALDFLRGLPSESVNCVVTSPPYWNLRNYGVEGQWGLEDTPEEHVHKIVVLFREAKRVLRDDGVVWLNYGSSYAGSGKSSGATWEDGSIPLNSAKQVTNTGSLITAHSMSANNEPFMLRDDLTPDELIYVLSELAIFRKSQEISVPNQTISVDQAVTPLADSK